MSKKKSLILSCKVNRNSQSSYFLKEGTEKIPLEDIEEVADYLLENHSDIAQMIFQVNSLNSKLNSEIKFDMDPATQEEIMNLVSAKFLQENNEILSSNPGEGE